MKKNNLVSPIYALIVWLVSVLFYLYEFILQVSPGVLSGPLHKEFHLSGIAYSQIGAIYFFTYAIMQIPSGTLLDTFGPRKVLSTAALFCVLGSFSFSYAPSFHWILFGRFLTALGSAFAMIGSMKLAASWFSKERFTLLSGCILFVGMMGALFAKTPLAFAVESFGWRDTLFYLALIGVVIFALVFFIIRDYPSQQRELFIAKEKKSFKLFFQNLFSVIKNYQTWLAALYGGLMLTPILSMGTLWGEQYLQHVYNYSQIEAAATISCLFIGMGVGGPLSAWASNYFKSKKITMMIAPAGSFICLMLYIYISTAQPLYYNILGFLIGVFTALSWTAFSFAEALHPKEKSATAVSIVNFGNMLIGAAGQMLIGIALDIIWSGTTINNIKVYTERDYETAFIIFPIFTVIALVVSFFMKEKTALK